jgi:Protein of unknown function (DUF2778)
MTVSTALRDEYEYETYGYGRVPGSERQKVLGRGLLACIALACAVIAWTHLSGSGTDQVSDRQTVATASAWSRDTHASTVASAYARLSAALKNHMRRSTALTSEAALFDSRFSLGFPPGTFALAVAVKGDREPSTAAMTTAALSEPTASAQAAPPAPSLRERVMAKAASAARYIRSAPSRVAALRDDAHAAGADTTTHEPTIFEKLFGKPSPLTLAYAASDDGGLGLGQGVAGARYDQSTAVYDISAHTVYLPDGTQLEAHSGLGAMMDDPHHVDLRMRGATPPTVYDLRLREASFHGVQAIRLVPVDEDKVYGRSGLLAHTYMLGSNGQSNGCVSFKNYEAFLRAYMSQKIKRLAVVAHLE